MKGFKKEKGLVVLRFMPVLVFLMVMLLPVISTAQEQISQHVYDRAGYFSSEEIQQLEALCLESGENSDSNIILLIEDGVEGKQWKKFMED